MSLAIKVENLGKRYRLGEFGRRTFFKEWRQKLFAKTPENEEDYFWALKDINFDIQEGEVTAIIGHNGAGKSTLLKILSSITSPTHGSVKLKGRVASLLEVGTGFHQELSGRDNVFLNGAILGMSTREVASKFDDIMEFSEIGEFIDTPVKRYSSGMRVRLAFAVAANLEPEILIIDEVLAVGDAAFQQRCIGKIGNVSQNGRTVIFVSHNAAAVESLCKRGIVLSHGKIDFDGTQTEALRHYAKRHATAGVPLHERTDHIGTGEVVVTHIEYRGANGETAPAIAGGMPLEVWLHYERKGAGDFSKLSCKISVTTHLGAPVFTHSNWFTGESFGSLPERGILVCKIPQLPLPEGAFKLGYVLHLPFGRQVPLDAVKHAIDLHVLGSDFFKGGKVPKIEQGVCLVPGAWRLEQP